MERTFNIIVDMTKYECKIVINRYGHTQLFSQYDILGSTQTELRPFTVELGILNDIKNLMSLGYQYDPSLLDNTEEKE